MKEVFRHDSPFMVGLRRFFLLVQLNILWAICCLPVVTIGAATVSMYRTVAALRTDMEAGEETVELFSFFFRAFRQEFRQSTLLMLVKLAAVALGGGLPGGGHRGRRPVRGGEADLLDSHGALCPGQRGGVPPAG